MNAPLGLVRPDSSTLLSFSPRTRRSPLVERRGVAAVLITTMLFVFVILAAITIDFSYMQLVQTEMRAATDSAAKAGAEALARNEDINIAKQEAVRYAAANRVGGQPFRLSVNDVRIGRIVSQGNGRWGFTENATPPNAVRVDARTGGAAAHSAIPLHFSNVLGRSSFSPHYAATAGQQEVKFACVWTVPDRCSSTCRAPTTRILVQILACHPSLHGGHLAIPPFASPSDIEPLGDPPRFDRLVPYRSRQLQPEASNALVTWGSNYTMPIAPSTFFPEASTDYNLPAPVAKIGTQIPPPFETHRQSRKRSMMGGTNLSAGLDRAVSILRGPTSSSFTNKVVILFTDGQWNAGRSPILAANDARAQGITVHCVSMLTGHQPDLQSIADITGGRYIRTSNTAELRQAFIDLANSLPVVLTE